MLSLVDAYRRPHRCLCDCHRKLSLRQRVAGVAAMMRFDDMLRGWGVTPLYEPEAPGLFQRAKMRAEANYRKVAIRDHACLFSRLLGFAVHELIHALLGEPSQANWGMPWGLPYGVPHDLPPGAEAGFLFPYNLAEACAFVGVERFAKALFIISWPLHTARDVGTYGFWGGNAIVPVPPGFRAIAHIDRQLSPQQYYLLARQLETQADAFMDEAVIAEWCAEAQAAESRGRQQRASAFPEPLELASLAPIALGRNDKCSCGSGNKYKRCCGALG